ncbi:hypothetical protein Hanom_Chr06g00559821 [Helianthus anomalus]
MDALEVKATFSRIESTLLEMINLLKMESQRWATYSHTASAATPPPASLPPQPTLSITPPPKTKPSPELFTPPPPKRIYLTNPSDPTPLLLIPMNLHHHKIDFHLTCYAKQPPNFSSFLMLATHTFCFLENDNHMPKQTILLSLSNGMDIGPSQVCHYRDHFHVNTKAPTAYFAVKREWRPPWLVVITSSNAKGRVEWQPP